MKTPSDDKENYKIFLDAKEMKAGIKIEYEFDKGLYTLSLEDEKENK